LFYVKNSGSDKGFILITLNFLGAIRVFTQSEMGSKPYTYETTLSNLSNTNRKLALAQISRAVDIASHLKPSIFSNAKPNFLIPRETKTDYERKMNHEFIKEKKRLQISN